MADNISFIKDPTLFIKPGDKLVSYLVENINGLGHKNKRSIPGNILKIIKNKENKLEKSDIEWLNEFLINERRTETSELLSRQELDDEIKKLMQNNFTNLDPVDLLKEKNKNLHYLHDLMEGSELILPENEIIKRNPVLEERVERLKREQEEKEYQAMTQNIDTTRNHHPEDSISYQMKMMNRHLIAVAQLIVSVGAGFAFGFLGIELLMGDLPFGIRLLLGISCALIIGIAEFYFLAKSLNEEDKMEEKKEKPGKFYSKRSKTKVHKD